MKKRLEVLIEFTRNFGVDLPDEVCFEIAKCYEEGIGTEINLEEAKKWKKVAKKQKKVFEDYLNNKW